MNKEIKNSVLYPVWKTAWRMRCCPPDNVLYGEKTKELQEHLESCLYCREDLEQMEQYSNAPLFSAGTGNKERTVPHPGQLWSLKQELGGWGPKKRYYSPPLVVVTEVSKDNVTVLQSCGDMALAGSDDISFQNNMKGFIQPWNQYSLRIEDLDICYGAVAESSIQKTQISGKKQVIEPGSLLWFFRQMEVETGYFFSSRAVNQLLLEHEFENRFHEIAEPNPQIMHKQLCKLGLMFPQSLPPDYSIQDLFFNAQAPDALLPLAASDNSTTTDFALCLTMRNDKPENARLTGITIKHWNLDGGFLNIVGQLHEIISRNAQFLVRLQVGERFFDPVPGEFGIEKDLFWALFQVDSTDVEKGECVVRIIHEH